MTRAYLRSFPGVRLTIVIPFFYAALIAVSGRWQFIGDVYLTLETLPNATIYVLPLVAGLAAFDTSQIAQPGLSSILSVATRGRIARFLPSLAVASASATFHVIVSGLMLVLGGITSPRVGWWMVCWTIAIQCAMFFVMALLGAVVAFVVAPRIAAFFFLPHSIHLHSLGDDGDWIRDDTAARLVDQADMVDLESGLSDRAVARAGCLDTRSGFHIARIQAGD